MQNLKENPFEEADDDENDVSLSVSEVSTETRLRVAGGETSTEVFEGRRWEGRKGGCLLSIVFFLFQCLFFLFLGFLVLFCFLGFLVIFLCFFVYFLEICPFTTYQCFRYPAFWSH